MTHARPLVRASTAVTGVIAAVVLAGCQTGSEDKTIETTNGRTTTVTTNK